MQSPLDECSHRVFSMSQMPFMHFEFYMFPCPFSWPGRLVELKPIVIFPFGDESPYQITMCAADVIEDGGSGGIVGYRLISLRELLQSYAKARTGFVTSETFNFEPSLNAELLQRCDGHVAQLMRQAIMGAAADADDAHVCPWDLELTRRRLNAAIELHRMGGVVRQLCGEECMERAFEACAHARRLHACARKIQRAVRHALADPSHDMCRRRLLREFAQLQSECL